MSNILNRGAHGDSSLTGSGSCLEREAPALNPTGFKRWEHVTIPPINRFNHREPNLMNHTKEMIPFDSEDH